MRRDAVSFEDEGAGCAQCDQRADSITYGLRSEGLEVKGFVRASELLWLVSSEVLTRTGVLSYP